MASLRVDGAAFIAALTQQAPAPALLDGASSRLRRTNPTRVWLRLAWVRAPRANRKELLQRW